MDKEMKNMRELSIDEMDKVVGGMIIQDKDGKYWVYSDDGKEMLPNAFYDLAAL